MNAAEAVRRPVADYGLSVEDRFHDDLIALPREAQKKVLRALRELQRNPAHLSKPMQGFDGLWRREVAPYRILFTQSSGWVHVYSVQHRQGVYQGVIAQPRIKPATPRPEFASPPETGASSQDEVSDLARYIPWHLFEQVLTNGTPDPLYELIDFGLPGDVFDRVMRHLATPARTPVQRVRLVRQNVIDAFFGPVLRLGEHSTPLEITIVSPWVTPWSGQTSSLRALVTFVRRRRIPLVVVTRPPLLTAHRVALTELQTLPTAEIVILDDLHAKFFVADVPPVPLALLGSANSTARSLTNLEVGVAIQGTGEAEGLVRDLQSLAIELRGLGRKMKRN